MQANSWKNKLLLTSILVFSACSEDYSGGSRNYVPPQEEETFPPPQTFETRINNRLLIGGVKCSGGETTEYNDQTFTCMAGQYLITLDDFNVCTNDGVCTEIFVVPIVGDLTDSGLVDENFIFWNMVAISPASDNQTQLLHSYQVKADKQGNNGLVVPATQ